jgi:hypothetical protein
MLHLGSCPFFPGASPVGKNEVDSRRWHRDETFGLVRCALPFPPLAVVGPYLYFNEYEKIEDLVRILVAQVDIKIEGGPDISHYLVVTTFLLCRSMY